MTLNKYSQRITQPKSQGASQAMLYGTGMTDEDMNKPQVGIGSVWYEGNTCNMHLLDLAAEVKNGVTEAGLVGMRFNTIGVFQFDRETEELAAGGEVAAPGPRRPAYNDEHDVVYVPQSDGFGMYTFERELSTLVANAPKRDFSFVRKCRHYASKLTDDGILYIGSEAGAVILEDSKVISKGRLGPGQMLSADTSTGLTAPATVRILGMPSPASKS